MTGLHIVAGILMTAWTIVIGIPMACAFVLSGRCAREEEKIFAEELWRKSVEAKPTPRTRPFVRETHVLDYSTMTKSDIREALGLEATR